MEKSTSCLKNTINKDIKQSYLIQQKAGWIFYKWKLFLYNYGKYFNNMRIESATNHFRLTPLHNILK